MRCVASVKIRCKRHNSNYFQRSRVIGMKWNGLAGTPAIDLGWHGRICSL